MSTTRQSQDYYPMGIRFQNVDNQSGVVLSDSTTEFPLVLQNSVTYGDNFKSWRERIRAKLSATTNLDGTRYFPEISQSTIGIRRQTNLLFDPSFQTDRTWYCVGFPLNAGKSLFVGPEDEAFNQARRSFIKKARNAQTSLQGGVFIAELGKTIRSILRPAKGIDRLLKRYLRGLRKDRASKRWSPYEFRRRSALLDHASDKWLETQYGILPLLSDIDGAAKALGEFAYRSDSKSIRSFGVQPTLNSRGSTSVDLGYGAVLHYIIEIRSAAEVDLRGGVTVSASSSASYLPQSLGFTLSNFLPTIYELIPYSFLVDYFTNLGEMIDAYTFAIADVTHLQETVRRIGFSECVNVHLTKEADTSNLRTWYTSQQLGKYLVKGVQVSRRAVNPATLLPSFGFKVPGIGSTKWLNMAALGIMHTKTKSVYFR